jgi:GTP-sensing pleiotropic transcriptional regulator CodY
LPVIMLAQRGWSPAFLANLTNEEGSMTKSTTDAPLGIIRSVAVISLGVVALAGSIASVLVRRILTPASADPAGAQISKLVTDEWEADLARLNLPSRSEVDTLNHQITELEAQLDQLIQQKASSQSEQRD